MKINVDSVTARIDFDVSVLNLQGFKVQIAGVRNFVVQDDKLVDLTQESGSSSWFNNLQALLNRINELLNKESLKLPKLI